MTTQNRVWIELERSDDAAVMEARAKLASKMLQRLGDTREQPVFVGKGGRDAGFYCIQVDMGGSYVRAVDNGHWFNLDHLGRA